MSDPTPPVPLGLSTPPIAEALAFVTESRRGDAVILRTIGEWTPTQVLAFQADIRDQIPGVPVLIVNGGRVGVHVIRGGQ